MDMMRSLGIYAVYVLMAIISGVIPQAINYITLSVCVVYKTSPIP